MIEYTATGYAIGTAWGGHELLGYTARKYSAETFDGLLALIKNAVNDCSVDSGFGFQNVYGAYMDIVKKELREIDGRGWRAEEPIGDKIIFAGWLHAAQKERVEDFIIEVLNDYK
jgi:hypothetical protein